MMFVTFGSRIVNSHFFNCFWFQQWHSLLDPEYGGIDYAYRIHSNHLVQKTLDIVQSDQRRWTESHNTAANCVQQLLVQHVQEYYVEWRGTHSNLYCIHLHANDERARSLGMQSIGWFIFCALHFNQFFLFVVFVAASDQVECEELEESEDETFWTQSMYSPCMNPWVMAN